jgi:hypothetical protein
MVNLDADAARFTPTEEWIEALAAQCTDAMRLHAKRYAARRLRGIGKLGVHVDDYAARELVQDALGDTLAGVVSWDPAAKSLQQHIEDTIQFRTRNARERAKKFRRQGVDVFGASSEQRAARAEVEGSMRLDHEDATAESCMFASEVLHQLRTLAANDLPVLRYLDAIARGARSREDIMHAAQLNAKAYRNVRGRLRRLAEQLDHETIATLRQA